MSWPVGSAEDLGWEGRVVSQLRAYSVRAYSADQGQQDADFVRSGDALTTYSLYYRLCVSR